MIEPAFHDGAGRPFNFLPGPVEIHPAVHEAFARGAISHRSSAFLDELRSVRSRLCAMTGAAQVEVLLGSGTLANDAIAAQLSLLRERGLILSNGEFGGRIAEQARRFGLEHTLLETGWGEPLPYERARRALTSGRFRWIWAVHCETSTGVLNDLEALKDLARASRTLLCLDCISSLGTVPVALEGVHLASGVSGKGLASYPGLALVFHRGGLAPSSSLPRYLDLGLYAQNPGTPFTSSSNLVYALSASLDRLGEPPIARVELSRRLRARLEGLGFSVLAPLAVSSPAVLSLVPPVPLRAFELGEALDAMGFQLSYRSEYLVRRNVIQVCLMGDYEAVALEALLGALGELSRHPAAARRPLRAARPPQPLDEA